MSDDAARILVVCTGNIARSPLCAALIRRHADDRLGAGHGIQVASAGVHALAGQPAVDGSLRVAREHGLDLSAHRSQPLTRRLLAGSDLVLAMTVDQRDRAVRLLPWAVGHTFSLVEFARLTAGPDGERAVLGCGDSIRALVDRAHRARPVIAAAGEREDVADPYGGPDVGYLRMAERLVELTTQIATGCFPSRTSAT